MKTLSRYDVVIVKRRFSGLNVGDRGVCSEVGTRNGTPLWTVLMENNNTVTILGKEVEIFFKRAGRLLTTANDNKQLLKALLADKP